MPMALCALWLPINLLGEGIGNAPALDHHLGLGFVAAGLVWVVLGANVWGRPNPPPNAPHSG